MLQQQITEIPLDDLHESPFNPRKTFTDIESLATTIKAAGRILSPLLVRPRIGPLFAGDPDATAGYEIVFGHRRFRGAEMAGLATAPCMVRAMSDDEARLAQTIENLERKDVHPIEEAEGFQYMMDNDGRSADDLAAQFGQSRSYIYGRLKLLQACPEVRAACVAGQIGSEVALLIARLRTTKLQEKALNDIKAKCYDIKDGGKRSFRSIRDHLAERYTLTIKSAIFNPADASLVPAAGACATCPKLTGNAPEFADLASAKGGYHYERDYVPHGGADTCTDPDCFDLKKKAHLKQAAAALVAKGQTVVDGNKARAAVDAHGNVKGAYVALKSVEAKIKKVKSAANLPIITIQDQRTGQLYKALKRTDLAAAGVVLEQPQQRTAYGNTDYAAKHREREAKEAAELARRQAVHAQVRPRMLQAQGSTAEMRLILQVMLDLVEWQLGADVMKLHGYTRESFSHALPNLTANELRVLLLDVVLTYGCDTSYDDDATKAVLHGAAACYGVDPETIPTPSAAGAGAPDGEADAGEGKPNAPAAAGHEQKVDDGCAVDVEWKFPVSAYS